MLATLQVGVYINLGHMDYNNTTIYDVSISVLRV